jgi:hypothetical protein
VTIRQTIALTERHDSSNRFRCEDVLDLKALVVIKVDRVAVISDWKPCLLAFDSILIF